MAEVVRAEVGAQVGWDLGFYGPRASLHREDAFAHTIDMHHEASTPALQPEDARARHSLQSDDKLQLPDEPTGEGNHMFQRPCWQPQTCRFLYSQASQVYRL